MKRDEIINLSASIICPEFKNYTNVLIWRAAYVRLFKSGKITSRMSYSEVLKIVRENIQ
jgi:hypothetical protein